MLKSTKKLKINVGKFDNKNIILYSQVIGINKRVNEEGNESYTITINTFYYEGDDVLTTRIIDETLFFNLTKEDRDVYFEKFNSKKVKFSDIEENMYDYLSKDLIVEKYEGKILPDDLDVYYDKKKNK